MSQSGACVASTGKSCTARSGAGEQCVDFCGNRDVERSLQQHATLPFGIVVSHPDPSDPSRRRTALSQPQGGIVWGMGMALFEESLLDPRYGRFANGNLAE